MKNSLIPNAFNRESNFVFLIRECFRERLFNESFRPRYSGH